VLIYFDQPTRHDILRRIHPHVAADGYLLLGSSETTLDMPADLTAMWDREQLGRVQAHRPAGAAIPRPVPAASPISAALTGA
jgi:chemotaxis protein methyltransferase CheR